MVVVRTEGELYGEHQEAEGPATELHGPFQMETDTKEGTVKTRTKRRRRQWKGTRMAMSAQTLQRAFAEDMKAEEYAKSPPRACPKPTSTKTASSSGKKAPQGFEVCPDCRGEVIEGWNCERCDGNGLVRIQVDGEPDEPA